MTESATPIVSSEEKALLAWLQAYLSVKPRGTKTEIATSFNLSPSGLSKILERGSGFDLKTIRLMSLIMSSKDEEYEGYDIVEQRLVGSLVFFTRVLDSGMRVTTWRPASEPAKAANIQQTIEQIQPD